MNFGRVLVESRCIWRTEGDESLGKRVKRSYKTSSESGEVVTTACGTITRWLPGPNYGKAAYTIVDCAPTSPIDSKLPQDDVEVALWHVIHDDGDEEDLEKHEVEEAIRCWAESAEKVAFDNRPRFVCDGEACVCGGIFAATPVASSSSSSSSSTAFCSTRPSKCIRRIMEITMNDDVVALYCSARLAAKDIGTSVNDVSAVLRRKRQVTRSGRLCRLRYFRQPSVSIAGAKRPRPAKESVINIGSSAELKEALAVIRDERFRQWCRREGTIISSSSSSLSMVPATSRKYPTELSVEATDEKLPLGELDTDFMDH